MRHRGRIAETHCWTILPAARRPADPLLNIIAVVDSAVALLFYDKLVHCSIR